MELPYLYARLLLAVCLDLNMATDMYLSMLDQPVSELGINDLLRLRRRFCAGQLIMMACGKTLNVSLEDLEGMEPSPKDALLAELYARFVKDLDCWQPLNDPHAHRVLVLKAQVDALADSNGRKLVSLGTQVGVPADNSENSAHAHKSLQVAALLAGYRLYNVGVMWNRFTQDTRENTIDVEEEKKRALMDIIAEFLLIAEAWPLYFPCAEATRGGASLSQCNKSRLERILEKWPHKPWNTHRGHSMEFMKSLNAALADLQTLARKIALRMTVPQR